MYRPWFVKVNWTIVVSVALLIALGFIVIYSATFRDEGFSDCLRQLSAFGVGIILSTAILSVDYRWICTTGVVLPKAKLSIPLPYIFYFLSMLLLVFVLKKGESALGAQRWIRLGTLGTFQPSEFAKLAVLLTLATFFSNSAHPLKLKSLLTGLGIAGVPLVLVLIQPDLGTSIIIAGIFLAFLFFLGINPLLLLGSAGFTVPILLKILKPYQRQRLLIFLNPERDPAKSGYNIIQSLIAIGSGRFSGQGLFAGSQTQLKFVPERSTDFIFTVIAEEVGFLGSCFMLLLYLIVLWYGIQVALETEDSLGKLLAAGIVGMLFLHVFVNIGMTLGIMPITGIPLPFISSGGSSLITNMAAVALLVNIGYRHDRILPVPGF